MPFEKPDYRKGDVKKMLEAEKRRQIEHFGRPDFPEQKAAATAPAEHKKTDYRAGDPEKLKALKQKLGTLYPEGHLPAEKREDKQAA